MHSQDRCIRCPELDSHTYRNETYEAHPHADTINLLLSIGESTLSVINSETPVSPVPCGVSPHMDVNARIKVLTRRITICNSELPDKNRTNGPLPKYWTRLGCLINRRMLSKSKRIQ